MIKLHGRLKKTEDAEPFVARVVRHSRVPSSDRYREIQIASPGESPTGDFRACLVSDDRSVGEPGVWLLPSTLDHLSDGDIVRISPRTGDLWVMYRRASPFNSMLLTERCNSNCLMCSQPPKDVDDRYLLDAWREAIPLMSPETAELGVTGGEPTLLGEAFLELVQDCRTHLPSTALHVLSNGRLFSYLSLCRELAAIQHPDLMIGIPLYSDIANRHDYVVQAAGAFDQTVRGLMNLGRYGVPVEIRIVLHRETVDRLPQFARFIARNLPFVSHVALMGLEMMGYVKMNLGALWVDPADYQVPLRQATEHLAARGLRVSIYNHQLCVLDSALWPFARKSISDWKNEYFEECGQCNVIDQCGGFFSSATLRRSSHLHPLIPGPSCPLKATCSTSP